VSPEDMVPSAVPVRQGCLVAVVGPSGAGKDTLINAARIAMATHPRLMFARRVITRPADVTEPHDPVTEAQFEAQLAQHAFAFWWQANGLFYGIPATAVRAVAEGGVVVVNVSRESVPELQARYPCVRIVHVTAAPETRAMRLALRGREPPEGRASRMARKAEPVDVWCADLTIINDGAPEPAIAAFEAMLMHLLDH
jgi:ribose 1,5-bisphosphokinase